MLAELVTLPADLIAWLLSLERPFAFLLALPFVVGAAGLLSEQCRRAAKSRIKVD